MRIISDIRFLQGEMVGKLSNMDFEPKGQAMIEATSLEIVKSNAIEGNVLNREDVRSSIAKRLGFQYKLDKPVNRDIDGMVEMMFDATQRANSELTEARLNGWHGAIFPTGYSGVHKINVGTYRNTPDGRMEVTSSDYNRPLVHFEAPVDDRVKAEMNKFIEWFNSDDQTEPIIKSCIAHLWFVTIHPYEDGNGRMARAITDLQLVRSDKSEFGFYSLSDQIEKNRKGYYSILEKAQRGDLDITDWLFWHSTQIKNSLTYSKEMLAGIISKSEFWLEFREASFNERQRKMINMLFDGFEGKLQVGKYAKICKCSEDTALRDIKLLLECGAMKKGESSGRSSYYYLSKLGDHT